MMKQVKFQKILMVHPEIIGRGDIINKKKWTKHCTRMKNTARYSDS